MLKAASPASAGSGLAGMAWSGAWMYQMRRLLHCVALDRPINACTQTSECTFRHTESCRAAVGGVPHCFNTPCMVCGVDIIDPTSCLGAVACMCSGSTQAWVHTAPQPSETPLTGREWALQCRCWQACPLPAGAMATASEVLIGHIYPRDRALNMCSSCTSQVTPTPTALRDPSHRP